jgi:anaerobic magnesium-protoporphyrin IX monomethyl ester cyclase
LLGGPLVDAGHTVWLIDNDLYGWDHDRLASEIRHFGADCIMIGHTGSTAAHATCLATAEAVRGYFPDMPIAYGGVYPSYADTAALEQCPAIDVIVRGEGEDTVLELAAAWQNGTSLADIPGITWRNGTRITTNRPRPPIQNLDAYRPGWELVAWSHYKLYNMGRAAGCSSAGVAH